MSDSSTLYERLGGGDAVEAIVDEFYDRVVADQRLAPYFEGVDMERQRAHQAAFIGTATGGPEEYDGDDMRAAHADLDLTEDDFAAVADHLDAALRDCGVAAADRRAVMETVGGLKADVLGGSAAGD